VGVEDFKDAFELFVFYVGAGNGVYFPLFLVLVHLQFSQQFAFGHVCVEQFDEVVGLFGLFLCQHVALVFHALQFVVELFQGVVFVFEQGVGLQFGVVVFL
jgi:hypothetical protein